MLLHSQDRVFRTCGIVALLDITDARHDAVQLGTAGFLSSGPCVLGIKSCGTKALGMAQGARGLRIEGAGPAFSPCSLQSAGRPVCAVLCIPAHSASAAILWQPEPISFSPTQLTSDGRLRGVAFSEGGRLPPRREADGDRLPASSSRLASRVELAASMKEYSSCTEHSTCKQWGQRTGSPVRRRLAGSSLPLAQKLAFSGFELRPWQLSATHLPGSEGGAETCRPTWKSR